MRVASLALIAIALAGCGHDPAPPAAPTTARSAATTTTAPATARAVVEPPLVELLDAIRRDDPEFPTTRPLAEPLELPAAARLRRAEPVFLCSRGDLWITRADAPPTPEALALAPKRQTHVVRDRVRFVYWRPGTQPWSPELIARDGDHDAWITATARVALDQSHDRDWSRAVSWNTDRMHAIAVPTSDGFSILTLADGKVDERYVKLCEPAAGTTTQAALDVRGLIAWSSGGDVSGVARFVDGAWKTLAPSDAWPESLAHVVPFQDGSVLTIGSEGDRLTLRSVPIDTVAVDEAKVRALVARLADQLPENREAAQAELAAIGPGAWPLLADLADAQRAEARIRIRAILGNQTTPTLGGIAPAPGPSALVARLGDGGVVLYFAAGASSVDRNGVVQRTIPAWLAVRSSGPVRALPPMLAKTLSPDHTVLKAWADEWIVEHDVDGPLRWLGNHFEPLVRPSERDFKRFVGIDSSGRWIYQTLDPNGPTLIVDPTLPDPRPKLPVWTIDTGKGRAGWTDDNWPAIARGGAWVLKGEQWAALKGEVDEKLKNAATMPSTQSTDLLTDSAGDVYADGATALVVRRKDGTTLSWPLPPEALGSTPPVLLEADDRLFLFNSPGRVIRLRRQFEKLEPFKIDAVFSRNIPGADVRRIWKDPAGRLVIASNGNELAVCFPSGRISYEMSNMIPARDLRDALRGEDEPEAERR